MIAINNLGGTVIKDGKVVYSERLEDGIIFVIIQMYKEVYEKENYGASSQLGLLAVITDGSTHAWSNGVHSLNDVERQEIAPFSALRELRTKDNYKVWEHAYSHHPLNGKDSRRVKWLVEVPKKELGQFFSE